MPRTISIIIPSLNQAHYLEKSIESVLQQAGDFDIDLIVADGGSKDGSIKILERYQKTLEQKHYPIKCKSVTFRSWSEKDSGQSSALNKGFRLAKGDVIAWLGSDDYYLPGAFAGVMDEFAKDPELDFIYGDCLRIYESSGHPPTIEPRPREDETFESLRSRGNSFALQSTFHAKKIFGKIGYFDERLHYCMDLDMWMRIFLVGKVKYLPLTLAAFRIWTNSKTGGQQEKFRGERKIIAKRYGGNIISPHTIYRIRGGMPFLNPVKDAFPKSYASLKKTFYSVIDLFKYSPKA